MNSYTYDIVVREQTRLARDPEIKALYWQDDEVKPTGTLIKNPKMAETLEKIAQQGDRYLYGGALGQHIVDTVNRRINDQHEKLSLEDFKNYQVKSRDIIESDYRGSKIVSFGYPASGGVMVAQSLKLLEPYDISQMALTDVELGV